MMGSMKESVERTDSDCQIRIEHVSLYVEDLEKARDFFVKYLGGESGEEYNNPVTGFRSYFITFDQHTRLELMTRPDIQKFEKIRYRTGYDHIAFSVGSRKKVDELTGALAKAGYSVLSGPRTTGDGYYESCVVVIEGNLIELTV